MKRKEKIEMEEKNRLEELAKKERMENIKNIGQAVQIVLIYYAFSHEYIIGLV